MYAYVECLKDVPRLWTHSKVNDCCVLCCTSNTSNTKVERGDSLLFYLEMHTFVFTSVLRAERVL